MVHPLIKNRQTILPFLVIWFFVMTVHFLALYYSNGYSLSFCIADSVVSTVIYMFISLVLWYPIRFGITNIRAPLEMILNNSFIYAITTTIWIFLVWGIIILINPDWSQDYKSTILSYRILASLMIYIASVVVYYAIGFYESLQEKQANEMQLKTLVKEAQLNELRAQLHPHFLFNSLNSINSLTISNPNKAGEMIIKLSEFIRYSLSRKGNTMADFEKEIHHVQLYLDIEKVRFGNRLNFVCDMDNVPLTWPVPLMLLQPLVENAVKHGVYNSGETTTIKLRSYIENNFLIINISNNFDPDAAPEKGTGTGINNVKERMRLVYGQADLFSMQVLNNEFLVILKIPETS